MYLSTGSSFGSKMDGLIRFSWYCGKEKGECLKHSPFL